MSGLKVGRIEQLTHTPAPWECKQRVNGRWVVGARERLGGSGTAAKLSVMWDVANGTPGSDNTAEANARLIAAAPELLAALRGMLKQYPHLESPATTAAEAAIAKAEGQ